MSKAPAAAAFLDVPYNVAVDGHVSGTGKHREFPVASGELTPPEFTEFLREGLSALTSVTKDGGIHFVCIDHHHIEELRSGLFGSLRPPPRRSVSGIKASPEWAAFTGRGMNLCLFRRSARRRTTTASSLESTVVRAPIFGAIKERIALKGHADTILSSTRRSSLFPSLPMLFATSPGWERSSSTASWGLGQL